MWNSFNYTVSRFCAVVLIKLQAEIPYNRRESPDRFRSRGRSYINHEIQIEDWELELEDLVKCFQSTARKLKPFKDVVSQADRAKVQVPEALPNAWVHLVMALVLYMVPRLAYWKPKADVAANLLSDGEAAMLKGFLTLDSLLDNTVFTPFDLATLLVYQLGKDVTNSRPDIEQTYSQYLALLVRLRTYPFVLTITDLKRHRKMKSRRIH